MTAHISDELPRLLTGEAPHDVVLSAAEHLRRCPDCQEELVSALVSHASLTSAHRFAPEVLAYDATASFRSADDEQAALPDLSAIFEQARAEANSPKTKARAKARSAVAPGKRGRYLIAASVAAVLVGGGAATVALTENTSSSPASHNVALAAYDVGHVPASATIRSDGEMTIDATSLPHLTGQRYEVWLTDARRTSMKPVGWIGSNGKATLTVPSDLMGTYSYIEVSRQKVSSPDYTYSDVSVLRGKYTA
jgi:hypothetical protein